MLPLLPENLQSADILRPGASWVREVIDPTSTLPEVMLQRDRAVDPYHPENRSIYGVPSYSFHIYAAETHVGETDITMLPDTGELHFSWVQLYEANPARRKGMGLATYLIAIETAQAEGRGFVADCMVSPSARKIWELLIHKQVATAREEFQTLFPGHDNQGIPTWYRGKYCVAPTPFATSTNSEQYPAYTGLPSAAPA